MKNQKLAPYRNEVSGAGSKMKIKKLLAAVVLGTLFFSLIPSPAHADLIPCGPGKAKASCELCDLFVLLSNILNFIFLKLIPPIAALMAVIGGFLFVFSAENPENVEQGKKIFTSVVIGLVVIYASWLFINFFLVSIGVAEWTGLQEWFKISCSI